MFPRFEKYRSDKDGQFYFRLRSKGNGENILYSEGYKTEASCDNGIDSVKRNAPYDERYERKENSGRYSFVLKAGNGEPIGRGESYTTAAGRDNGIEAVKRDAPDAPIADLT